MWAQKLTRFKALERDGNVCVATNAMEPEVYHIWPFRVNDSYQHIRNSGRIIYEATLLLDADVWLKMENLLAPCHELAPSDKAFNMLSLSPQLHQYWQKAYFGLKWVGPVEAPLDNLVEGMVLEDRTGGNFVREKRRNSGSHEVDYTAKEFTTYQVEWRWLAKEISDSLKGFATRPERARHEAAWTLDLRSDEAATRIEASLRATLNEASPVSTKGATALHAHTGRPIKSGDVITLRVESKDLDKVKTLIETQWIAVQMAAFSGAADAPDDLDGEAPVFEYPSLTLPSDEDRGG